jgi:cation transport ATPase
MKLRLLNATLLGILLWVLIFAEISIVMFSVTDNIAQKIIHFAALAIFVLICGYIYFVKANKEGWKEGFLLGGWMILVGTVLDIIITVPLFVKSYVVYYMQWNLWAGFIEAIIIASLSGIIFKER